eukprot:12872434-Ditylum_brightwellii.AAC.1
MRLVRSFCVSSIGCVPPPDVEADVVSPPEEEEVCVLTGAAFSYPMAAMGDMSTLIRTTPSLGRSMGLVGGIKSQDMTVVQREDGPY